MFRWSAGAYRPRVKTLPPAFFFFRFVLLWDRVCVSRSCCILPPLVSSFTEKIWTDFPLRWRTDNKARQSLKSSKAANDNPCHYENLFFLFLCICCWSLTCLHSGGGPGVKHQNANFDGVRLARWMLTLTGQLNVNGLRKNPVAAVISRRRLGRLSSSVPKKKRS